MKKNEKHLENEKQVFSGVLFSSFGEEILPSSNITDAIAAYTLYYTITHHCHFVLIVRYFPIRHEMLLTIT